MNIVNFVADVRIRRIIEIVLVGGVVRIQLVDSFRVICFGLVLLLFHTVELPPELLGDFVDWFMGQLECQSACCTHGEE